MFEVSQTTQKILNPEIQDGRKISQENAEARSTARNGGATKKMGVRTDALKTNRFPRLDLGTRLSCPAEVARRAFA